MIKKLRLRFVCINMLIVTAMLCGILGTVMHFTRQDLERRSTELLTEVLRSPMRPEQPERRGALPYFVLEVGFRGDILVINGSAFDLTDEALVREILDRAAVQGEAGLLEDYGLRFSRESGFLSDRFAFVDISSERTTMQSLLKTCLLIGAAGFAAFLVLSILLARWAIRPVETAWNQQRQFIADASHELKTPLTVILTSAELLSAPDYDEATRTRLTGSVLTMARQMRGLVERLLELARADNGSIRTAFAPVDLSALSEAALLPFEPVFFERGLSLESTLEPGLCVEGSESHLRQVVEILLDNAQKYSDPGGTTLVTLRRQGRSAVLEVSDPGAEIPKKELSLIFRRFYRADSARSDSGSYGLGLSIAEQIVREHRGKIRAESGGGRNRFLVTLPLK